MSVDTIFPTLARTPWRRFVTSGDAVLNHSYSGKGTEEEPYVVDWLEDDPENPMTWGQKYKWFVTMTVAIATLAVAMASSTLYVSSLSLVTNRPAWLTYL